LGQVLRDTVFYPGEEAGLGGAILSNAGFPSLIFAFAGLAFRHRALRRARRLVLTDQTNYDGVWASILADSAMLAGLDALQLDGRLLVARLGNSLPRQLNRAHRIPSTPRRTGIRDCSFPLEWDVLLDCGMEGTLDPARPVVSLDQLYCQAIAANPILIRKVARWAAASDGCFQVHAMPAAQSTTTPFSMATYSSIQSLPQGYMTWTEISAQGLEDRVCWARVKSVQRCVEKAARSYAQVNSTKHRKISNCIFLCVSV
jgi:hypothetical protein